MIQERIYQPVEWDDVLDCVKWCQNKLNLRDWNIEAIEGSQKKEAEDACASIRMTDDMRWRLCAKMYIDFDVLRQDNTNPYRAICHEMIHIFTFGVVGIADHPLEEKIAYQFEDFIYQAYCADKKIKPAAIREEK